MKVLFATAELAPFVKVGGLADASAGLVRALRRQGADVEVVLPDYGGLDLDQTGSTSLGVPEWAGPAVARHGYLNGFDRVSLIATPAMARSHPYNDADGVGWPDNDARFISFSAAVAALSSVREPDLLHLNDWHTGATLGFLDTPPPTVFTIHNLAYQGWSDAAWLRRLSRRSEAYEWYGGINPLTGAVALADAVVTVSPTFARETLRPETGFGVHGALAARGPSYLGILNGIDTDVWNPATDPHLPLNYDAASAGRKREIGRRLAVELGWEVPGSWPLIGMVTRLTDQKGVDLALEAAPMLPERGARMVLLGSGERALADRAHALAVSMPAHFAFREGYDEGLAHRIFAGSDLFMVPSRFEPAGLTQMQAMRYGTLPVVTDVGGLHDTVVDADSDPVEGVGFVAPTAEVDAVSDALMRGLKAWRSTRRRGALRERGMRRDWSWETPAIRYRRLYEQVTSAR